MHLHQYFTDFETLKARFREEEKNNAHFLSRNISTRYGTFMLSPGLGFIFVKRLHDHSPKKSHKSEEVDRQICSSPKSGGLY